MDNYIIKNNPICSFISVLLVIIFSLYLTTVIKTVPCKKDMTSIFLSNFIHVDFIHLVSNLYGIYSLSRVENILGSKIFFLLIFFILFFNTFFESILHKLIDTPCTIGFSGILYGVLTFEFVYSDKFDYNLLSSIIIMLFINKFIDKKSSFIGHLVGAISGIISGFLYKKIIDLK